MSYRNFDIDDTAVSEIINKVKTYWRNAVDQIIAHQVKLCPVCGKEFRGLGVEYTRDGKNVLIVLHGTGRPACVFELKPEYFDITFKVDLQSGRLTIDEAGDYLLMGKIPLPAERGNDNG